MRSGTTHTNIWANKKDSHTSRSCAAKKTATKSIWRNQKDPDQTTTHEQKFQTTTREQKFREIKKPQKNHKKYKKMTSPNTDHQEYTGDTVLPAKQNGRNKTQLQHYQLVTKGGQQHISWERWKWWHYTNPFSKQIHCKNHSAKYKLKKRGGNTRQNDTNAKRKK